MIYRLEPCPRCNVRADVGCRHRAATGEAPPAIRDPALKRERGPGPRGFGGLVFHPGRHTKSKVAEAAEALFSKRTP